MTYSIKIKSSAKKSLQSITRKDRLKLIEKIDSLVENPHQGSQLKGSLTGLRRIRVGHYRIMYEVQAAQLVILIVRVGHRKNIYK